MNATPAEIRMVPDSAYNPLDLNYNHLDKPCYINGKLNRDREDGPAIEGFNFDKYDKFYYDSDRQIHRVNGPAIERKNGTREWFINGKRHRENGPTVQYSNGYKAWYLNGKFHRENGPAIHWKDGHKEWYFNGELHRENGPSVEYPNSEYKEWFINGLEYTEKEYKVKIERIRKIRFKYFKQWEEICDQPGKKLFEIRINRAMDNIQELENNYF